MNKEYILRLMEQASVMIYRVQFFKKNKNSEESIKEMNDVVQKRLGLPMDELEDINYDAIIEFLITYNSIIFDENIILIAQLFFERGELYSESQDEDNLYNCFVKALGLYLNIFIKALKVENDNYDGNIDELLEKLDDYHIPVKFMEMLFEYRVLRKQYAKAETVLFQILDNSDEIDMDYKNKLLKDGLDFYNNLSTKSSEELEEGDFSLEEVECGMEDLKSLVNSKS